MPTDRFIADKATLRTELEKRARSRIGKILDAIKAEEAAKRMPDLGCLVVTIRTGLPGYVKPGDDARKKAIAEQDAVFEAWAERP